MKLHWITFFFLLALGGCTSSNTANDSGGATLMEGPVQWLTFSAKENSNSPKKIVLVSGDEEYRSEEALPQMAKILSEYHGFDCTVLFAQDTAELGVVDPNFTANIPGLSALDDADLMILFTRFRNPPVEQMQHFERYLQSGKPVIGIRTATHAFDFKDTTNAYYHWGNSFKKEGSPWQGGFGRLVLGEQWYTHHGHHKQQSTRGIIPEDAAEHPITNGIESGEIWGPTDVYGVRLPLPGDSRPLVLGQVVDRDSEFDENDPFYGLRPTDMKVANVNPDSETAYNPNDPMMPIAWLKSYQLPGGRQGTAFTSTIGSSTDMTNEGVRRLFVNATYYLLGLEVPERAKVDLIGDYQPSAYNFHDDEYWDQQHIEIAKLKE